ncbi:MAG: glycosyltransferase family 2 protein [Bacillota bacterium]|nr:glycosyltransferase family 2 protein [Bacillota bacterium]
MKLSIVVPIYNEEENVEQLHEEIVRMCRYSKVCGEPFDWEIIFVDDGSDDRTPQVCKELKPLRYIRFRRNYGQTSAMDCGIKKATGEYIATLDGDGQNNPADIPRMIEYLIENDLDVVSGWRRNRQDPIKKKFDSRMANLFRQKMVHDGIHDSGCTLKIYRAECFRDVSLYGDQHRFIPAILKGKGYKIGEVEVNHRPRLHGETKYNFKRVFHGVRDLNELRLEHNHRNTKSQVYGYISGQMINSYYKKYGKDRYSIYEEIDNTEEVDQPEE